MTPRPGLWALLALLACAGCALLRDEPDPSTLVCRSDAECAANEVCFPDGCGNPGRDIVVEVTPNPQAGLHAQDFRVENLRPVQNLELFGPASVAGHVVRATSLPAPDGGVATHDYSEPLRLSANGTSTLLPGVARQYEASLVPLNGTWRMRVGTGAYTVTLMAEDPELPPVRDTVVVEPGAEAALALVLPAPGAVVRLSGRVVRQEEVMVDTPLDIQALDADLTPLSQRVEVTRGTGAFTLVMPREAARRTAVLLRVRAVGTGGWVPQKTFTVDPRAPLTAPLELGDYGEPVPVTGRVLDLKGAPVAGATVALRGRVGGGGDFHSPLAKTDAGGGFALRTLPAAFGGTLTLVVVPPPGSEAGLTTVPVDVPRTGATLPEVVCPSRRVVTGVVLRPDSDEPESGVRILAEPVDEVPGWPRPSGGGEALSATDVDGSFRLRLDPAVYRVDFIPTENRPRITRLVTVLPSEDPAEQKLAAIPLQKGRTVRGRVTEGAADAGPARGLPYASVRFFRVANVEGRPLSVLLAQTVTDPLGNYTVLLPVQ
ncbi:MAG TPA: carboxypeptidase regulatory-like domain-containing protein [Myxococcus sp.]|nr:carboxypeptidase regulatory-like domain-containing protein [Myxococcus sp.]